MTAKSRQEAQDDRQSSQDLRQINQDVALAEMRKDIGYIKSNIQEIKDNIRDQFVSKVEHNALDARVKQIERYFNLLVGLIITAVVGAVLTGVLK
jgi:hypothetical protein